MIGLTLTWTADVFQIIAYASRAFAAYYCLQAIIAVRTSEGTLRRVSYGLLAVLHHAELADRLARRQDVGETGGITTRAGDGPPAPPERPCARRRIQDAIGEGLHAAAVFAAHVVEGLGDLPLPPPEHLGAHDGERPPHRRSSQRAGAAAGRFPG